MGFTGIVIGSIGYHAFQNKTEEQIFNNLSNLNWVGYTMKIFYSLSLLASIVLYAFNIMKLADKHFKISRIITRVSFIVCVYFISILMPNITSLFGLMGCITSVGLGFIFPIILSEKYF